LASGLQPTFRYGCTKEKMVGESDEDQQCDGLEKECLHAIKSQENSGVGEKFGRPQQAKEIESQAVSHVHALLLYQSGRKKSFRRPEKEAGESETGVAKALRVSGHGERGTSDGRAEEGTD
jgi:hypothetical protein